MMFKELFAVVTSAFMMCSSIQVNNNLSPKSAVDLCSLDTQCKGYGQGRECDENNRPVGASMFNDEFCCYDAYAVLDSDNEIYLTFDQGYENGYTEPILDTLKEKNVKAVFFVTGDYARRNQKLIERMINEGHIIGNHGMDHASLPKLSIEDAEKEVMSLHDFVKQKYNYEMVYFRPPCGEYSEQALAVLQNLGYKTLLWSFAYPDWDVNNQPDTNTAFERVSGASHGGGIFLLHSVSSTNAKILGDVIDRMQEQGFTLTVPTI